MSQARPRAFSGIQPSSESYTLGNYLGAVRRWAPLQESHDALFCVVDQHAITAGDHDPQQLRQRSRIAAAQLFASGLSQQRCTVFVQSHVAAHSQLGWLMECSAGLGEAYRMTQFKDKVARGNEMASRVGLLTYPMLMAADILLYHTDEVPVGEDQRQHVELCRDLALRFNSHYGDTFTVPRATVNPGTAKILDLADPAAKMSKSRPDSGTVLLLDDPDVTAKKLKRAVTDTGTEIAYDPQGKPGVSNLLSIHAAFSGRSIQELVDSFAGQGYGHLKMAVAEVVNETLAPFRAQVAEILADPSELDRRLAVGAQRATELAAPTLAAAYDRVGFLAPPGAPEVATEVAPAAGAPA